MSYLTYLKIHHFKSIEDLELKDLSHINIIVGANNSGKTSLLEAMSILGNEVFPLLFAPTIIFI